MFTPPLTNKPITPSPLFRGEGMGSEGGVN